MALSEKITELVNRETPDRVFLLTDSNVLKIESALIEKLLKAFGAKLIVTPAGEEHKDMAALSAILASLTHEGATRRSLLICIGGGMVTDIGGFAASVFKRGIRHINISTTLLGAADASIGGKTGIDFEGLKNEIGAFHMPLAVIADTDSFKSLPAAEILSGFGEVIKTAMIGDADMTERVLSVSPLDADTATLDALCAFCRIEKERIVKEDPRERGLRKILNFGHTAGHAIESLMLEKGVAMPHGSAIAHGILVALILSCYHRNMANEYATRYAMWLRDNYPQASFTCKDYPRLLELAAHDKKNDGDGKNFKFVLLDRPGEPVYDCDVGAPDLERALDLYQELMGR